MLDLKTEQEQLYQLFCQRNARCFLRVDQSDEALWVTDLPRRSQEKDAWRETLKQHGVRCMEDPAGLWHLDWTEAEWERRMALLPTEMPKLPDEENEHDAYALCRFGLLHPAPADRESRFFLRKVLKGKSDLRTLHETAAEALRAGQPIAYDAARVLAATLALKENKI